MKEDINIKCRNLTRGNAIEPVRIMCGGDMNVIAVMGSGKGSGKTTTVESIIRKLTSHNYRVGTVKQIHEEDFSIDVKDKDTWRHAEAGAVMVVSAAPHEIAAIKRLKNGDRFEESMRILEREKLDLVIVEGNPPIEVPKIFVSRDPKSAKKVLSKIKGKVICITTLSPEKFGRDEFSMPVFHSIREVEHVIKLIEEYLPARY